MGAFRKAGKPILDTAKTNFEATKKGKSKTGYADVKKSFKSRPMRKDIGMIFGLQYKEGYKYRFLNSGTKERFTKSSKRFTGILKPSLFFDNAVISKRETAQNILSEEIKLSLERVVKKYETKAGK